MIKIIGLDPGLQRTGWGIIKISGSSLSYIAHGVVETNVNNPLPDRLNFLHQELMQILQQFQPDEAAIEETFVNSNPASTLKLGMARGVILFTPAAFGLPVSEYSANKIKKTVVGSGHADKYQVAHMISLLLPTIPKNIKADAADALAIAICHAHHREVENRFKASSIA